MPTKSSRKIEPKRVCETVKKVGENGRSRKGRWYKWAEAVYRGGGARTVFHARHLRRRRC